MYVITGATGNTGSIIASTLLEAGQQVRIIAREIFVSERNEENTTPTSIEEFAYTFGYVFNL